MATWAQRASAPTDAPSPASSSTPAADPSTSSSFPSPQPPAPAPAPKKRTQSLSKANASDNWRASARPTSAADASKASGATKASATGAANTGGDEADDGGWETVEKKDKHATAASFGGRFGGGKKGHKDGSKKGEGRRSGSNEKGNESSGAEGGKGKGSAGRARATSSAAPKEKKDSAAAPASSSRPSLKPAASWADDDGTGMLPSPNFGASPAPPAAVKDDAAVEGLALPPSEAPSPTSEKPPPVEAPAKKQEPAPPKVNVWSVRKEQLAQAAAFTPASEVRAKGQGEAPTPKEAIAAGKKQAEKQADKPAAKQPRQPQQSQASKKEGKARAGEAEQEGKAAKVSSTAGWSRTPSGSQQGPVVVAGEDAASWPAPEDAVKGQDESVKPKKEQAEKLESQPAATGGKKKKGACPSFSLPAGS